MPYTENSTANQDARWPADPDSPEGEREDQESYDRLVRMSEFVQMTDDERRDYRQKMRKAQRRWDAFYANPANGYC